jgi:hypothetical protein
MSAEACAIDPMRSLTPYTNPLVVVPTLAESKVMATFWTRHARKCPPFMTKWWVNFSY